MTGLGECVHNIERAAKLIRHADGLLITAGAGMGVDSGLPDFRCKDGFWKTYPALAQAEIDFYDIATPDTFQKDPILAWGFYGHRLNLYRAARPHDGFRLLLEMAKDKKYGYFVFTSNVDGQFQKAGFRADRIVECHGSIHHLQCLEPCCKDIWKMSNFNPEIDEDHCRLLNLLPSCPKCAGTARPNILMFNDWSWLHHRTEEQELRLDKWLERSRNVVIIELGAGESIPTVRNFGERTGFQIIRINPREYKIHQESGVGVPMGAIAGLRELYFEVVG